MKISEICDKVLKRTTNKLFSFTQMLGVHISPVHFYEPIPDTRKLSNEIWTKRSKLVGIDINEDKQKELLKLFVSQFKNEYDLFPKTKTPIKHKYYTNNGEFESVDGENSLVYDSPLQSQHNNGNWLW